MWTATLSLNVDRPEEFRREGILRLAGLGERMGKPCRFVLEGQERENERSYLGFGDGWVFSGERSSETDPDPLQELRNVLKWQESWKDVETDKNRRLESGLVGYLDYEWGLVWQKPAVTIANPSYFFRTCPVNLIWLPGEKRLVLEILGVEKSHVEEERLIWGQKVQSFLTSLSSDTGMESNRIANLERNEPQSSWQSNMSKEYFLEQVRRIQEYIKAGDVFQAVFSQRFSRQGYCSPWEVYRRLRILNPSPYLFFLTGKDEVLVGSSPELLVSTNGKKVLTRPIAGTRRRGRDKAEDEVMEQELLSDEKERAEHAMLVDLGRNDLGRVSEYGSVRVTQYAEVERFSHVMHLVSTVEGELAEGKDSLAALQAVFPAGTLTGAPKVRAMEILSDLEPGARGAYGGALGILRWSGDVDFCITIRTLRVKATEVSVQAGAGIVLDSQPEREYEETVQKAKALMQVVNDLVNSH